MKIVVKKFEGKDNKFERKHNLSFMRCIASIPLASLPTFSSCYAPSISLASPSHLILTFASCSNCSSSSIAQQNHNN
jgi:hypothetical protein